MAISAKVPALPSSPRVYEAALEGLVRVNEWIMRHGKVPPIYGGTIKYRREPAEVWRHAEAVASDGWGDCEDLAAYRSAELRLQGDSKARVKVIKTGPRLWHAIVERGDGKTEDPSKRLGMGREEVGAVSDDQEYIGADPVPAADVTWNVERTPTGWKGTIRIPLDMGRAVYVTRTGSSKDGAMKSAWGAATKVLDSSAAQALMPGPARFALNLVKSKKARQVAKSILSLF